MHFEPGAHIDQYEIIEALGEGAYAETYKARDASNDRMVVLKVANPMLFADPAIFARFRREAEIARTLDHPGVLRSLDDGSNRSEPYLVLEYIDGRESPPPIAKLRGAGAPRPRTPVGPAARVGTRLPARTRDRAPRPEAGEHPRHRR